MNAAGLVVKALAVAIAVAATKRNFMVTSCVGRESERRVRRFERRSGEQQHSTTDLVGGGFLQCGQADRRTHIRHLGSARGGQHACTAVRSRVKKVPESPFQTSISNLSNGCTRKTVLL